MPLHSARRLDNDPGSDNDGSTTTPAVITIHTHTREPNP